jgi:hypothetical protein
VITWRASDGKAWGTFAKMMRVLVRDVSSRAKGLDFNQRVRNS